MMMKVLEGYNRFDVVVVPFPFSDRMAKKRRPVVVLSSSDFLNRSGHVVTAMITTAKHSSWPFDTIISDLKSAGLEVNCLIRLKFFTADHSLIIRKLGKLSDADSNLLSENIQNVFMKQ